MFIYSIVRWQVIHCFTTFDNVFYIAMAGPVDTIISLDKSLPPLSIVLSFYIHDTVNDRWPTICKLIGILRGSTMRTLVLEMSAPFESRDENTLDVSSLAADWDAFFDSFKTYPTERPVSGIKSVWDLIIRLKFTRSTLQSRKEHEAAHVVYFNVHLYPTIKRHSNVTMTNAVFFNYDQEPYFEVLAKLETTTGH